MGLDQFARARKGEPVRQAEKYTMTLADGTEEERTEYHNKWEDSYDLAEWRKHPNLHGFMEDIWAGEGEFNLKEVELTAADLDDLEASVKGTDLPETAGFMFGDDTSEYYKEQDLEFCKDAREALSKGYTVVYSSWW